MAKKLRKKRGSLDFNGREVKFKLDENNKPIDLIFKIQKDANKLIEEYMLLANRSVAELINNNKLPMINRTHNEPDEVRIEDMKNFVSQFGYEVKTGDTSRIKKSINDLIKQVKGTNEENIVNSLIIKSMKKAEYSTNNIGHYGLGFVNYGHFTSPIRRYSDVILHRILTSHLVGGKQDKISRLESKCVHLSKREVVAQKASRDSIKFKQCEFMMDKVGLDYMGTVISVTDYGLFVEIKDTNSEGLVRLNDIEGDTYEVDSQNYCVKGFGTGEVIRLGDDVMIRVKSVDLEKKNIDLSLIGVFDK